MSSQKRTTEVYFADSIGTSFTVYFHKKEGRRTETVKAVLYKGSERAKASRDMDRWENVGAIP